VIKMITFCQHFQSNLELYIPLWNIFEKIGKSQK